jgi:superfamily I DNA/RNA helicase
MPKRSFYVKESELDEYQIRIINRRSDSSLIVRGSAGSGKSILALWKVKDIQNRNLGSCQFIVFTRVLKQYMADGVRQVGINADNVDSHWNWKKRKECPSSDYIIVDEAQDFSREDILEFKSRARKALVLYGDSAQQLYKFIKNKVPVSMEEIIQITGFPDEKLVFNHRLPKKIARVAERISGNGDDLEGRCRNEGVEKPKILRYESLNEQLDAIVEIIKNRNFEDVGILFRDNSSVEQAYGYLKNKGLNVEAKYRLSMDLNFYSDNPKLMTYHSSKGLQFEAVFLPECSASNDDDRNPLYVAITRAYQSLYVMHSGNLSRFFDTVPIDLYETSLASSTSNTELL